MKSMLLLLKIMVAINETVGHEKMVDFVALQLDLISKKEVFEELDLFYKFSRDERNFQIALTLFKKITSRYEFKNLNQRFTVLLEFMMCCYFTRNYTKGVEIGAAARKICAGASSNDKWRLHNTLGHIYCQLKNFNKALEMYQECYELSELGSAIQIDSKASMARALWLSKEFSQARDNWELVLSEMPKDDLGRLNILTDFAFMEYQSGDIVKAQLLVEETNRLVEKLNQSEECPIRFMNEVALHKRNVAAILLSTGGDPREIITNLLESCRLLRGKQLNDELVTVALLFIKVLTKYGHLVTDEEKAEIELLESYYN
ncbi:hypothetical protein [Brevibacillus brevis]|uniref:hypothetical protein n=1 Tax=Brevibacillus brevis TaxID=1393 RepID=UPI00165E5A5B|nr:hypothetical protein [Brevibacillus brevis]